MPNLLSTIHLVIFGQVQNYNSEFKSHLGKLMVISWAGCLHKNSSIMSYFHLQLVSHQLELSNSTYEHLSALDTSCPDSSTLAP